jgi:hypothetical protein
VRLITKVAAAAGIAVVMLAPAAGAQSPPPNIPTPPGAEVARFKMTIDGAQRSHYQFSWTPAASGCSRHAEGTITEDWTFNRGKGVVMEFAKFPGGHVVVQRRGRFGDASFAAPGRLQRDATGFFDLGGEPGCGGTLSLVSGTCGKRFSVPSDLRFLWNGKRLTLDRASTRELENPAEECGNPNGALSFDLFTAPYPLVSKQKGALTKRAIFGRRRALKVDLRDKFLPPLEENSEVTSSENLIGHSTVTLKRLPN